MKKLSFILLIICIGFSQLIFAEVKLPKLISDGMVLQRNSNIKIWGWAKPNEKIEVSFLNKKYTSKADKNGEWFILTKKLKAGGPYKMEILATNKIILNDILIGDVWIASGQSNMSYELKGSKNLYEEDILKSTNKFIRHFKVPLTYNFNVEKKDIDGGNWVAAHPKTVINFSAVAYFFAKKIYEQEKIPIGIINSSWGGTPAQAWTSEKALKKFPNYYDEAQLLKDKSYIVEIENRNKTKEKNWLKESDIKDLGIQYKWKSKSINESDWQTLKLPNFWVNKIGYKQGVVWFRTEIDLAEKPLRDGVLNLGRISDADSVFVNGKFIGKTSNKYTIRKYKVVKNILQKGKNTISVKVISYRYNGGFIKGNPLNLTSGKKKISLEKNWKMKLGAHLKQLPVLEKMNWKPAGLYNAMISPLLNYKIKGVIWYQGEGNVSKAEEYKSLFPTMITNWRENFEQGDFPFLFVQLSNFQKPNTKPSSSNWAMLREAQLQTLKEENTGMAVTVDIGEENDIHPKNKKDVGLRLASEANRLIYSKKKVGKPPYYKSMKIINNKIEISFTPSDYKLIKKGTFDLKNFSISANDKKFVWAKAEIKDNKIYVWSPGILNPVAVRYAWANNPENINLFDSKGYPISPFRTDNWKK